ncbi:MAG: hypothetical protein ACRDGH_14735 [Candidatus Limnocylindria bacterium]
MSELALHPVVHVGLGNSSYLLDLGDGSALAVDEASRDLRGLDRAPEPAGLRIRFAADTHLHADFVTGATELDIRTYLARRTRGLGPTGRRCPQSRRSGGS